MNSLCRLLLEASVDDRGRLKCKQGHILLKDTKSYYPKTLNSFLLSTKYKITLKFVNIEKD